MGNPQDTLGLRGETPRTPKGYIPLMRRSSLLPLLALALSSSCTNAQATQNKVRVMTYNIQWFSEDANPDRISNLTAVMKQIKPDVVAFQEVQSKRAVEQVFRPGEWTIGMEDDPKENQEPGVAVRAPFKLIKSEMIFPGVALDFAFPGGRNVLRAEVQSPQGQLIVLYVVHMKSRRGSDKTPRGFSGRLETDPQREQGCGILAGYLAARPDENSIVLGDFNDSPDDRSVNILESGNLLAKGGPSQWTNPLMSNLSEPLYRDDYVTIDLARKFLGEPIPPRVPGACQSNEETRGKPHRFPDDVKVSQTMFDQILVRPSLAAKVIGKVQIFSGVEALRGSGGRTSVTDTGVNYTEKGSQASDHLPVYVDLGL